MAQNEASKRAASMVTIAQHKFKQALKKEDNHESRLPPVALELSAQFLSDLDAVLKQSTPVNVQKCTVWIVKHVAPSRTRISSLGDYLVSRSKSIVVDQPAEAGAASIIAARRRFVPLLIINDVLHTDKYHQRSAAKSGIFGRDSMLFLPELVDLAAACIYEKDSQAEKKLRALLNYWAINQLFAADDIKSLRDRADEALLIAQGGTPVRKRSYLLPEYHGDRNAPWYDLPASYMLEQMIRNPDRPIDPQRIKIAKLDKKPVSAHVRKLLDNYLDNIDLKYMPTGDNPTGETKKYKLWLDPMGQLVKQNKETGETSTVCNGYGWSRKLCQDMQRDGVPQSIKTAREEIQREEKMEKLRPAPQQRKSDRRYTPSPRRRRSPSSDSNYRRGHSRHSRSRSRHSSRSSHGSEQHFRPHNRARSRSRRRVSPPPERRNSFDRGRNHDGRPRDHEQPPRPYGGQSYGSGQQWNGADGSNRTQAMSSNSQYPPPPLAPNFSPAPPPPPFGFPPFPPPPPMPNQYPGQFPMQPYPPLPFPPGAFPGGVPPPPPPNFSGPYPPPPPNVAAMPNNAYAFGGNQYGHNERGGNVAYGQNAIAGQNQGNYQGGRGGFRGGGGGGYGNRGGHGGQQRGQRGRW